MTLVYFGSIDCVAGKYAAASGRDKETDCVECGVGKYSIVVGSLGGTCIPCIAGKYIGVTGSDEESDCIQCNPGSYTDNLLAVPPGGTSCIACAEGQYSTVSTEACIQCVGKYTSIPHHSLISREVSERLLVITAGKYVETAGSDAETDCIACGAGKYSTTVGSVTANDCIDCVITHAVFLSPFEGDSEGFI